MQYQEYDLKAEQTIIEQEAQEIRVIPSCEDSYERLLEEHNLPVDGQADVENAADRQPGDETSPEGEEGEQPEARTDKSERTDRERRLRDGKQKAAQAKQLYLWGRNMVKCIPTSWTLCSIWNETGKGQALGLW
ncbi:hypothetical protein NSB25_14890 [Acetatifactor muris]|uniref:Uncharacterized protein n=1 Tax=Acetatifactor muris TaxID=879566 RepID=A0A2K4ZIS8_9FIRM|nr:hypothetical protein [Acetatifactor muris]MCR2048569.1 hypothetical protein [Acetatifactor muris]SOY30379.1 hypothetical protein AMURIS_03106 [Acetatifactor muris]